MPKIVFPHDDQDWLLNFQNTKTALDNIIQATKVNKSYDIPYLAGYSVSGDIFYIDRDFGSLKIGDQFIDVTPFLILHELVEKSVLLWLEKFNINIQGRYMFAHQLASLAEKEAVETAGLDFNLYNQFFEDEIRKASEKKIEHVPADLDLTPYQDEQDYEVLKQLVQACSHT